MASSWTTGRILSGTPAIGERDHNLDLDVSLRRFAGTWRKSMPQVHRRPGKALGASCASWRGIVVGVFAGMFAWKGRNSEIWDGSHPEWLYNPTGPLSGRVGILTDCRQILARFRSEDVSDFVKGRGPGVGLIIIGACNHLITRKNIRHREGLQNLYSSVRSRPAPPTFPRIYLTENKGNALCGKLQILGEQPAKVVLALGLDSD